MADEMADWIPSPLAASRTTHQPLQAALTGPAASLGEC
jgi:hypothetical protein